MQDEDPMAEFLAREQAILGADAALFGNPMTTDEHHEISPSLNAEIDQLVPMETPAQVQVDNIVDTDLMGGSITVQQPIGGDFMEPAQQPTGVFAGFNEPQQSQQQSLFEQPVPEHQPEEKSQALIDWQAQFEEKIAERDQKAKEKHERMLIEAKEQLDKFYAEYNEKKAKGIQKSKELETQTIASLTNTSDNIWESVLKQIEVAPKAKLDQKEKLKEKEKKDGKKVASETARFKQILTSLKNDPKAPGLIAK